MIEISSNSDEFAKDMEELKKKIEDLVGNAQVRSCGIKSKNRSGRGYSSNAQIVDKLIEDGRDFFTLSDSESKQVVSIGESELEKRASVALKKGRTLNPNAIWTAVYTAMLTEWMKIVQEHIEQQTTASGSPKSLDPKYLKQKIKQVGYDTIGVMTKQLLDNFNPTLASRNIEIKLK